ncbi:hypothetical protein PHSY_000793 [Pseudozyma hubeiensis SY62]|uniref:Uncharacterized protein n=1 Tax=Pseudozyma hubeiensis (strain SY62) TaxID=1305764 RepID=R9P544_PSEHS|nr:hypothetical protein PHSY_000793 [Pseudozyma hubeiensis SY62]GAC93230.1 hypothetical protein PHSY_000793 [Pseudozyma hubeiensis SY62]
MNADPIKREREVSPAADRPSHVKEPVKSFAMPFSPTHASMFTNTLRRTSFAHGEEIEHLSSNSPSAPSHNLPGMQPSASTSWINPFGRASFSVDRSDDVYVPPESLPSSRRPAAATIISTLLHSRKERSSQDGLDSEYEPPAAMATARRPSAIFKAWKNRRASQSNQASARDASTTPTASTGVRRTSFAVSRVLTPSALRNTKRDDGSISSDDTRRRSLSIVCRGERESNELDPTADRTMYTAPLQTNATANGVTAAMAIRDTWLYASHQYTADDRKGSVSTIATSPTYSNHVPPKPVFGRKSISGVTAPVAVGLDVEDQRLQHESLQQRLEKKGKGQDDGVSVVSLSLTEEIALYTTDVETVEKNAGRARASVSGASGGVDGVAQGGAPFVWNLPVWNAEAINGRGTNVGGDAEGRLPELSPAPAVMIADPFDGLSTSADMQRTESGALDPALSPLPSRSPSSRTPSSEMASIGHHASRRTSTVQFATPQWNTASPFRPDAPLLSPSVVISHRPSIAASNSYHSAQDHSPTSLDFPPSSPRSAPSSKIDAAARRGTTYYDASSLPIVDEMPPSPTMQPAQDIVLPARSPASPVSVRSFGHSETSFEMRSLRRRTSYSLPRPPPGYEQTKLFEEEEESEEHAPTPRLLSAEFESTCSPLSSSFEPETPGVDGTTSFPSGISGAEEEESKGRKVDDAGDDLHAQFCSVLLLDLGDGRAIPLGHSPGIEPRADPFALSAH